MPGKIVEFKVPHNLTVVSHPLVLHKLTLMRDKAHAFGRVPPTAA